MARFGFLTLYATGHLNPSLALARALQEHGHYVVFFNLPDTAARITAAGLSFVPYGEAEYPAGSLSATMQKTAELSGPPAFAYYIERMILFFQAAFKDLPERLKAEHLDLLLVDQVCFNGATLAEHVGVPFVSIANALLLNREDVVPPPVMLWPYDDAPAALERNRKGWAGVDQAFAPLLAMVNAQRQAWDLTPHSTLLEDSFSTLAQICQQPAFFEFPRQATPPSLHFVGPLQDDLQEEVPFEWEWLDGRPLIYASCGTLQNRLEHVFHSIIAACAPLDAQTVIALGQDALAPSLFGDLPSNIKLVGFAPQRELLSKAALCITHAGLNTTLDCLQFGVPMVAIPIASEQPGIAMRIAHLGAGLVIPLPELEPAVLSAAVVDVLSQTHYRAAAQKAARASSTLRPRQEAVRILERVTRSAAVIKPGLHAEQGST